MKLHSRAKARKRGLNRTRLPFVFRYGRREIIEPQFARCRQVLGMAPLDQDIRKCPIQSKPGSHAGVVHRRVGIACSPLIGHELLKAVAVDLLQREVADARRGIQVLLRASSRGLLSQCGCEASARKTRGSCTEWWVWLPPTSA